MLQKGEFTFHLADLPKSQADTIRNLIQQNIDDPYTWLCFKIGSPRISTKSYSSLGILQRIPLI